MSGANSIGDLMQRVGRQIARMPHEEWCAMAPGKSSVRYGVCNCPRGEAAKVILDEIEAFGEGIVAEPPGRGPR